jgi:hypothetical protein
MAKRKYSKMKKIEPSVQTMTFALLARGTGKEVNYIDLSQCASLVNRRFYRQGINWAVSGFKVLSAAGVTGDLQIGKLPNTWVMSNAWEKGFRAWQRMNKEALVESPSVRPKFLDFKIYADVDHHLNGYGNNLLPLSSATVAGPIQIATAGEWEPSKFVIPKTNATDDTISHEIMAVGPNYPGTGASGLNAVSLIEGYAASRGLPDIADPNTPDDAALANGTTPQNFLAALFNEGTDQTADVISDMITENNIAPYPFENDGTATDTMYPGGANQLSTLEIHDSEYVTGTTIGGTTRLKGGNFPCGIVAIATNAFDQDDLLLVQVNLVPGNHRGYLCEPMTEM